MRKTLSLLVALCLILPLMVGFATVGSAGEKVTLEYFQQKREVVDIINEVIANFMAENPDITIEQNNVPDATPILKTRLASNDVPDIYSAWFNVDGRMMIDEGYAYDLTEQSFMKKVTPMYLDATKWLDKNWMLPISINFVGVYVNNKELAAAGQTLPTTRDEMYAVCDALKGAGYQAWEFTDKEQWTIGHGGTVIMENMFDVMKLNDVIISDLSVRDIEGFEDYCDWLIKSRQEYGQADSMGTAYEAGLGDFANGNGVMLSQGNWIIPVLNKANPDFDFTVIPFPAKKAEDTIVHWGVDYLLCVSGEPKSDVALDASFKFLNYFVDTGAQLWADKDGSISCIDGIKSGIDAYKPVSDLVFAGKCLSGWFTDAWPAGCYDQFNIVQQNFLLTFDKEAFYDELDEMFKSYNNM